MIAQFILIDGRWRRCRPQVLRPTEGYGWDEEHQCLSYDYGGALDEGMPPLPGGARTSVEVMQIRDAKRVRDGSKDPLEIPWRTRREALARRTYTTSTTDIATTLGVSHRTVYRLVRKTGSKPLAEVLGGGLWYGAEDRWSPRAVQAILDLRVTEIEAKAARIAARRTAWDRILRGRRFVEPVRHTSSVRSMVCAGELEIEDG